MCVRGREKRSVDCCVSIQYSTVCVENRFKILNSEGGLFKL